MDIWRDGAQPVAYVALTGSFDLQRVLSLTGRKSPTVQNEPSSGKYSLLIRTHGS
jgi:hypothetical protein